MERDLLILTVYFICMGYVVYQMALAVEAELEDKVKLVLDGEGLENAVRDQLVRQGFAEQAVAVQEVEASPLQKATALRLTLPEPRGYGSPTAEGEILFQVLPQGAQPLQPLGGLIVNVVNQSRAIQATVDWDRSSMTRLGGDIRRVIRHTPGMRLDLASPQVTSVVNPNQFLSTAVTSEDCFGRNPDTQVLQVVTPLVDIPKLATLKMASYSLELVVQLTPFAGRGARPVVVLLPFRFAVQLLRTQPPPWARWILRWFK